ncbi:unnamed protein product [Phaeothamnion confervicola]
MDSSPNSDVPENDTQGRGSLLPDSNLAATVGAIRGGAADSVVAQERGPSGVSQLHNAAVVGDLNFVLNHIRSHGDLEVESFCGRTPLCYAAFHGKTDVVRALLIGGADVSNRGSGRSYPLHFGAWGGSKAVVRLLLEYGASPMVRDAEGNTPASYSEDVAIRQLLAEAAAVAGSGVGGGGPAGRSGAMGWFIRLGAAVAPISELILPGRLRGVGSDPRALGGALALSALGYGYESSAGAVAVAPRLGRAAAAVFALALLGLFLLLAGWVAALDARYWKCLRERDIELLQLRRRLIAMGDFGGGGGGGGGAAIFRGGAGAQQQQQPARRASASFVTTGLAVPQ